MIISFSREAFVQAIMVGTKIHTLREDKHDRWKPGNKIHYYKGNPRNKHTGPYTFGEGTCRGIQWVKLCNINGYLLAYFSDQNPKETESWNQFPDLIQLAKNDGFANVNSLMKWFVPKSLDFWTGKIIHFTDFKYQNHAWNPES
ncbi:MAG: hypothetical protein ABIV51_12530 [Saprospiraceae bacterium]